MTDGIETALLRSAIATAASAAVCGFVALLLGLSGLLPDPAIAFP